MLETISPRWTDLCIVAATGPSLTPEVAEACRGQRIVAVNDAYRLIPFADVLYAGDAEWWDEHLGCPAFAGEKWSSHGALRSGSRSIDDNKVPTAERYGLRLVRGRDGEGFSIDPSVIHWGGNSLFQAINWAIHRLRPPRKTIALVGADMHTPLKAGGFARLAQHLFGQAWKGEVARRFQVDPSEVEDWASGVRRVPGPIVVALEMMMVRQSKRPPLELPEIDGRRHFFGDHPAHLKNGARYEHFIPAFKLAARQMPEGVEVINCTPGSALDCFPRARLEDVL